MNADALGLVLTLSHATTEADAMNLVAAAILAGLDGSQAQRAFDTWHAEHARAVQVIGTSAPRCRCRCGPGVHVGGYGACCLCGRCERFEDAS